MIDWITQKSLYILAVAKPTRGDLGLPNVTADDKFAQKVFAIVFGIVGALAVLTIIVGSLNLAKSGGNPEEISKAKKTIIFSLVGLMVVLLAEAIVFFVIGKL